MIFGGHLPFFGAGLLNGIWLAFIGWFLNNAATVSYRQVVVHDMLEGVPVARLMRNEVSTVPPDITISELVDRYFMHSDDRAFAVVSDQHLFGMVSLKDVQKIPRADWDVTLVSQIMTPAEALEVSTLEEDAAGAIMKLARRDVNQIPVVDHGHLEGVLRRQDIVKWLQMHSEGI